MAKTKHQIRIFFFKPFFLEYFHNNLYFKFKIEDYNSYDWYAKETIGKIEIDCLEGLNVKNALYCGSHQCVIPIILLKIFKLNFIHCYEALKSNIQISFENLKLNDIENIKIINGVISDQDGFQNIQNNTFNSFITFDKKYNTKVQSYALKNIISKIKYDLIILDIEGFELKAISNCEIESSKYWFIELHGDQMLKNYGYRNKDLFNYFDLNRCHIYIYEINRKLIPVIEISDLPNTRCWVLIKLKNL